MEILEPRILFNVVLAGSINGSLGFTSPSLEPAITVGVDSVFRDLQFAFNTGVGLVNLDEMVVPVAGEGALAEADFTVLVGGEFLDTVTGTATDPDDGSVYVVGVTESPGWVVGGFDTTFNGFADAFLAKYTAEGDLLWSTYIGGDAFDTAAAVAVDPFGDVYVVGTTASDEWVIDGFDTEFDGERDAFAVKVSTDGDFIWSTYVGGVDFEEARAVAVDEDGSVFVGGTTQSAGWTVGGFDTEFNGDIDGFVAKLTTESHPIWSTYVGGAEADAVNGLAVDDVGDVVVVGSTQSPEWSAVEFEDDLAGAEDGFVIDISAAGGLEDGVLVGGVSVDRIRAVAIAPEGDVVVTGETLSVGWVAGGFDTVYNGARDGFVVSLDEHREENWSTFIGGDEDDVARAIAVDDDGCVYVVGDTQSSGWVGGGFQTLLAGEVDAFLVKLDQVGLLRWGTLSGDEGIDTGAGVALGVGDDIFVAGFTDAFDLFINQTVVGVDTDLGGGDGYFTKVLNFDRVRDDDASDVVVVMPGMNGNGETLNTIRAVQPSNGLAITPMTAVPGMPMTISSMFDRVPAQLVFTLPTVDVIPMLTPVVTPATTLVQQETPVPVTSPTTVFIPTSQTSPILAEALITSQNTVVAVAPSNQTQNGVVPLSSTVSFANADNMFALLSPVITVVV